MTDPVVPAGSGGKGPPGSKTNPLPMDWGNAPPPATKVSAKRTALTLDAAANLIREAWALERGETLTKEQLAPLVAQFSHETARGKSMFNWNPAGLKAFRTWDGHWAQLRTTEIIDGKRQYIYQPFRAFMSPEGGIRSWLQLLLRRHSGIVPHVLAPNPEQYAASLKASRYYTADLDEYTAGLVRESSRWKAETTVA